MSAVLGAITAAAREMSFSAKKDEEEVKNKKSLSTKFGEKIEVQNNESDHDENIYESCDEAEEEDQADLTKLESQKELHLGPLFSLKEQLEKDKVSFCFSLCLMLVHVHYGYIHN